MSAGSYLKVPAESTRMVYSLQRERKKSKQDFPGLKAEKDTYWLRKGRQPLSTISTLLGECRVTVRKAKDQLGLKLAKNTKKKEFFSICEQQAEGKTQDHCLRSAGKLVTNNGDKADFSISFLSLNT